MSVMGVLGRMAILALMVACEPPAAPVNCYVFAFQDGSARALTGESMRHYKNEVCVVKGSVEEFCVPVNELHAVGTVERMFCR